MRETKTSSAVSRLIKQEKGSLIFACVVQFFAAIAGVVPFLAVIEIGKALIADGNSARAVIIAWVAAGALALRLILILTASVITHKADADFQLILRRQIAQAMTRVPLHWFSSNSAGDLKKTMQDDVKALHVIVGHVYTAIVSAVVTPICALAYLIYLNPWLVPAAILPAAIGMAFFATQMGDAKAQMDEYNKAMSRINASALAYVQGISVIKVFGGSDQASDRFVKTGHAFIDEFWNWVKDKLKASALAEMIMAPMTSVLTAAGFGLALFTLGWINAIEVLALCVLTPAFTHPFLVLNFMQHFIMQGKDAAERLVGLLETPKLEVSEITREPESTRVEFAGVCATYDGQRDVLSDIELVLEPKTVTALVGPSGSGKTTLSRLLPRFFDPRAGQVTLGGVPLSEIAPDILYSHVSFVFQDVRLLRATIRDNVAMAAPDATQEDIERVAKAAHIHDRILSLQQGYDTMLGEGTSLSGGETQRITIARAMLSDTPIVVLDEAMAFADAENSAALRKAMADWTGARTVLMIAHDLSSVINADQICVMKSGRIVERGQHEALVSQGGLYAELWGAMVQRNVA